MLLRSTLQNATVVRRQTDNNQTFSKHCAALKAVPTLHLALKLEVILGASTEKCDNSFSILKIIMQDRRQSMKHARKAHLVEFAFEKTKNLLERKRLSTV